jgi:hypothetical protein
MQRKEGFIDKPYWSWESKDNDIRTGRAGIQNGRVSVSELLLWIAENASNLPLEEVYLSGGMVIWQREANVVEIAERAVHIKKSEERHAEWERTTYDRLKAKFEK